MKMAARTDAAAQLSQWLLFVCVLCVYLNFGDTKYSRQELLLWGSRLGDLDRAGTFNKAHIPPEILRPEGSPWIIIPEGKRRRRRRDRRQKRGCRAGVRCCINNVTVEKKISCLPNEKPWMNREVKLLLKARDDAFNSKDEDLYSKARSNLKRGIKSAKAAQKDKIESHFREGDPRRVWQGIQHLTNYKGCRRSVNNGDSQLAEELNIFFGRFEKAETGSEHTPPSLTEHPPLTLTTDDVRKVFRKVNPRKATGPDGIPGRVLRDCADQLAEGLDNSMNTDGTHPDDRVLTENNSSAEPFRLVGGASRCNGTVEVKHKGEWRRGTSYLWTLENTDVLCRLLDCGSAVSGRDRHDFPVSPVWRINPDCVRRKSAVRDCVDSAPFSPSSGLEVVCSESVRLVSGSSLCSGSVQIWDQSWDQSWTWLCEGALDLLGAEVLCRELGCGAPSLLQGALSPLGLQTFHCEGNESALMDCPRSSSRTCSSEAAAKLTCSDWLRLVGGASRCAGAVELKHEGEWRRGTSSYDWTLENTDVLCRLLDCGFAVSGRDREDFPDTPVWRIHPDCVRRNSAVRDCVISVSFSLSFGLEVVCSELLNRPIISLSVLDGVSELGSQGVQVLLGSEFRVTCSVEPQFPGGSFQLLSPAQNHTLPAVNHSAHFLFSDFGPAHQGNYTCVYHLEVFNYNFSSESPSLQVSMGASHLEMILRVLLFPLLLLTAALLVYISTKVQCRRATTGGAVEAAVELELDLIRSSSESQEEEPEEEG
ncbi:hypothetical protein WMY93_014144 [Mugilogobius chulae]|uniref:SRCR domain-containing protein n=1 Tax=Mugilogobius chulae TaxID=88201 RepID=A0AAW0P097_9GOBI